MKDLIYNFRKFILHSRRRYRPGVGNFWLNLRKDPIFRLIVILVFLLAAAIIAFVLLITVLPDNPVKAYFKGEEIKEVEISDNPSSEDTTPSPETSLKPSATPSVTPDPNEVTPTPLVTTEEKETTTAWITAASGLVVRTGPSTQSAKLGTLAFGAKVEIIQEGTWHFIEYEGGGGYVHSNYVVIGESPPGTSAKNTNTSQSWTSLNNSANILVEKIFYDGVTYYVADIKTDAKNLLTAYSDEAKAPSEMIASKNAAITVNGDYFGFREDGIIIRNGKLLRDEPYSEIAVLNKDGRLDMYFEGEKDAIELLDAGTWQCWSFGPILVKDFIAYEDFSGRSQLAPANPRTGIGMVEPGRYIIIVADGRQEASRGLTLSEFAALFEEYGCETAYNLDGGGASVMIFEDEIISSPSGGAERPISDVIYIRN